MSETCQSEPVPRGRLSPDVRPRHYTLRLELLPERERFSGEVAIELELDAPCSGIWLHGKGFEVRGAKLALHGGEVLDAGWTEAHEDGVARVGLPRRIEPQAATLRIAYEAAFDRQFRGLFRVESGECAYAFSAFEPAFARLCFPCFDEPAFKATFDVVLDVHGEHAAVAASLPHGRETLPGGLVRWHFARTRRLPTYLMSFAAGPLDVLEAPPIAPSAIRERAVPLRGLAVSGKGCRLAYALAQVPEMLEALESYFGIPYPFDKLDVLAVPGFPSALENAGAILFREVLLLVDGSNAPEEQLRAFGETMAHELAHQWFGNLVTMPWWDDLWLNEAFATWMAFRIADRWRPASEAVAHMAARIHQVQRIDSLASTRPIRQSVETVDEIAGAFTLLPFVKGNGILSMFERWLGVETFREGIRRYLDARLFGSATSADLFAALSAAAGRDVAGPLQGFLSQPGVPLVEIETLEPDAGGRLRLVLRQSRYRPAGSTLETGQTWQIPLALRYELGGILHEASLLLDGREGQLVLEPAGRPAWILPDAGGAGYYRWSLPAGELDRLLSHGLERLSVCERLSLADSLLAGFDSGRLDTAAALEALLPLAADPARAVAVAPMSVLRFCREFLLPEPLVPRLERLCRAAYGPVLERLSRSAAADGGERTALRASVLAFLALEARDPQLRAELREQGWRFLGYRTDGRQHPEAVEPAVASTALVVAVQEGDSGFLDALLEHLASSSDAALRQQILFALGHAVEPALAARVRELLLGPRLQGQELFDVLAAHLAERANRAAAWQWLREHAGALLARLPSFFARYLASLAASVLCTAAAARELDQAFGPLLDAVPGGRSELQSAVEQILLRAALVEAQRQSATRFFEERRMPG